MSEPRPKNAGFMCLFLFQLMLKNNQVCQMKKDSICCNSYYSKSQRNVASFKVFKPFMTYLKLFAHPSTVKSLVNNDVRLKLWQIPLETQEEFTVFALKKQKKVLHNAPYCTFKVTCPIKLMFIVSQSPQKVQLQCAEFKDEEKNIFSNQCLL